MQRSCIHFTCINPQPADVSGGARPAPINFALSSSDRIVVDAPEEVAAQLVEVFDKLGLRLERGEREDGLLVILFRPWKHRSGEAVHVDPGPALRRGGRPMVLNFNFGKKTAPS